MFSQAAAPVRPLLALTPSCKYLLTRKRQATSFRLSSLFSPLGHCSNLRHEGAATRPIRTSMKHSTTQSTSNPAKISVPGSFLQHSSRIFHFCTASASPTPGAIEECVLGTPRSPSYALLSRRHLYWPPPKEQRSKRIKLPSGKKCFVFNAKRDQDGKLEPVVCFVDSQDNLLVWFDKEEFLAFETLIPRLRSYYELWEAKAAHLEEAELHEEVETFHSPGLD